MLHQCYLPQILQYLFAQQFTWYVHFPLQWWAGVEGGGVSREEGGNKGVGKWVLVCLLRRADIIKDSPCVLPLLSSKGMLAPGSSASYCVALAEKGLCKWLWMAVEEGARALAVFPIYQQGGGYTNSSACFPTRAHANLSPALPHSLFSALPHTFPGSLFFCHPLSNSLPLFPTVLPRPPLSLFTSSEPPPLFPSLPFLPAPSLCLLCCVFVP